MCQDGNTRYTRFFVHNTTMCDTVPLLSMVLKGPRERTFLPLPAKGFAILVRWVYNGPVFESMYETTPEWTSISEEQQLVAALESTSLRSEAESGLPPAQYEDEARPAGDGLYIPELDDITAMLEAYQVGLWIQTPVAFLDDVMDELVAILFDFTWTHITIAQFLPPMLKVFPAGSRGRKMTADRVVLFLANQSTVPNPRYGKYATPVDPASMIGEVLFITTNMSFRGVLLRTALGQANLKETWSYKGPCLYHVHGVDDDCSAVARDREQEYRQAYEQQYEQAYEQAYEQEYPQGEFQMDLPIRMH